MYKEFLKAMDLLYLNDRKMLTLTMICLPRIFTGDKCNVFCMCIVSMLFGKGFMHTVA